MNLVNSEDVIKLFKSYEAGIKSIASHDEWFPVKSSPNLAGIVADLMGDGHLQGFPKWRLDYASKNLDELERFNGQIFELFGIRGKPRECTTNRFGKTFNLGVNCKLLGRILSLIGVPTGSKVLKKFFVPNWIAKDKECSRVFIKRLFSCEGCASIEGKNSFIEVSMWKSEDLIDNEFQFFEQIRKMLKNHFRVNTLNPFLSGVNKRKDLITTKGVKLRIKNLKDLIMFSKEIGFENQEKQHKLNTIIEIKSLGQSLGQ